MRGILLFTILLFCAALMEAQTAIYREPLRLNWELEYAQADKAREKKIKATVPGTVQLDIAAAERYDDYFFGENWRDYLWMEDQEFSYKTQFSRPLLAAGERLFFISNGIDYAFEIFFNGTRLHQQEGMYTPVRLDLTDALRDRNELTVRILPVPKTRREPAGHMQAVQSVKPAAGYGSDCHPRLITSGIWDKTTLEIQRNADLRDVHMRYMLNATFTAAELEVAIDGSNLQGNNLIWKLRDSRDKIIVARVIRPENDEIRFDVTLERPILWWPHDHGTPYLYTCELELRSPTNELIQIITKQVGFRSIQLVTNDGIWEKPGRLPYPGNATPAQLVVNGRKIFVKGAGFTAPGIFSGNIMEEQYEKLTDLAVQANLNLLRVWGGTGVNKMSFYEQCDRKGLLIWQEFPLVHNNYRSTPEFLSLLERESESIIRRLRDHPSIAIWSGGSRLFSAPDGMTSQSNVLRLLNSQCLKLNPETPFFNTSPLEGMAAGPSFFRDPESGKEVYELVAENQATAYTEFGVPAPAPIEVLRKTIPGKDRWPPRPGTAWESHHAFNAHGISNAWLMQGMIEDYFGPSANLEQLVRHGQLIQSEGYKAIYEEARRQKPYCSMAIARYFNEPWPAAAGNSVVSWPDIPKPAYKAIRDACRPTMASARIKKLRWQKGEMFETDLYFLNDSPESIPQGNLVVQLVAGNKVLTMMHWDHDTVDPNRNLAGPTFRTVLPDWDTDRFTLKLLVSGRPEYNSEYLLLYNGD